MTSDEFRILLRDRTDQQLLHPCLRGEAIPYAFEPNPTAWATFCGEVSTGLDISPADIRIIGSGRLGFSLCPGNNLRPFRDSSDIDVAIVNATAFDSLWLSLLAAAYPRGRAASTLGGWLKARKNEVYTGWLSPSEVRLDSTVYGIKSQPVLDFRLRWFNVFKKASRHPSRRHSDITYRLYRTWEHADLYTAGSLSLLRKSIFDA